MDYDEKADLERHRAEVEGLGSLVEYLGWPTSSYELGLDIGGGDGLHAYWLQKLAKKIIISDVKDYLGASGGAHAANIKDKLAKHGFELNLSNIEFQYVNAHDTPFKNKLFDFVASINAFEHIPDPSKALNEIIRITKPGALVILQFDPLWFSPFGHHLWHLGFEPWAHLLHTEEEFHELILKHGGTEQDVIVFKTDMNRMTFQYFKKLFQSKLKSFSKYNLNYWAKNEEEEPNMAHANFQKCLDRGYDRDDLIVRGFQFVGIRS